MGHICLCAYEQQEDIYFKKGGCLSIHDTAVSIKKETKTIYSVLVHKQYTILLCVVTLLLNSLQSDKRVDNFQAIVHIQPLT